MRLTGWVWWEWPGWHPLQPSGHSFFCYQGYWWQGINVDGNVPWFPCLPCLPPFSFLPCSSFHHLVHVFGLFGLYCVVGVFLVLLPVLAHLIASVWQPSLTNGCMGMYGAAMQGFVVSMGTGQHDVRANGGGGEKKGVMWQHVSHSYHIWDTMAWGPHKWEYISLSFISNKAIIAQLAWALVATTIYD